MAKFSLLLCGTGRAITAMGTATFRCGFVVWVPPACCAPPFVLLRGAGLCKCCWVRIVWMPLLQQFAVCCNGAAAAKPAKLASAVAEGAHDAACCFQLGEVVDCCIPLMHLATSEAAMALQPDPFAAAMSEGSRPTGSISPGMPPTCDAAKVRVGQGLGFRCAFHGLGNADCLQLAELTTLQTLHVSHNHHITDSGLEVRTFPLPCALPTGSHVWSPDMAGMPLHSRHMRSCEKVVSSTLTMMLAAFNNHSQHITCVSPPYAQG